MYQTFSLCIHSGIYKPCGCTVYWRRVLDSCSKESRLTWWPYRSRTPGLYRRKARSKKMYTTLLYFGVLYIKRNLSHKLRWAQKNWYTVNESKTWTIKYITYLAIPKSPTLIILLLVKNIFCVFRSLCKMFLSCMYWKKNLSVNVYHNDLVKWFINMSNRWCLSLHNSFNGSQKNLLIM